MKKYSHYIQKAIKNHTSLKLAVQRTITNYNSKAMPQLAHEITSLSLWDEDYLEVFDLLLQFHPNDISLLEHKALAYDLMEPLISIQALSQAIAILHQKHGHQPDISAFYHWVGTNYQRINKPNKAIAAFTLAISHFKKGPDEEPVLYNSYHRRAEEYLKINRYDLAKKDALQLINLKGKRAPVVKLLNKIEVE